MSIIGVYGIVEAHFRVMYCMLSVEVSLYVFSEMFVSNVRRCMMGM